MTSLNSLTSLLGGNSYLGALGTGYGSSYKDSIYDNDYSSVLGGSDDYSNLSSLYGGTSTLSSLYGNRNKDQQIALLKAKIEELEKKDDTGFLGLPKLGDFDTGSAVVGGGLGLILSNLFKGGKDGEGGGLFGNLFG